MRIRLRMHHRQVYTTSIARERVWYLNRDLLLPRTIRTTRAYAYGFSNYGAPCSIKLETLAHVVEQSGSLYNVKSCSCNGAATTAHENRLIRVLQLPPPCIDQSLGFSNVKARTHIREIAQNSCISLEPTIHLIPCEVLKSPNSSSLVPRFFTS